MKRLAYIVAAALSLNACGNYNNNSINPLPGRGEPKVTSIDRENSEKGK